MDAREIVASGWDAIADRYAKLEQEAWWTLSGAGKAEQHDEPRGGSFGQAGRVAWPRLRWLRELLDHLTPGSAVLDLGCGNALPAGPEILARGHTLLGVDVSARQIELARTHVPGGAFLRADMAELELADGVFDAVVSFYAIGGVPRERHVELLRRIHRWLTPGGLLLLSEEDADRPDFVGEWLGAPMFFSSYDAATLRGLVEEAGFAIERTAVETQREQGRDVPFTWILARRRESGRASPGP